MKRIKTNTIPVAISRAVNRLVVTHDPLIVRPGLVSTHLTVVGEPDRRVMRDRYVTTVRPLGPMRSNAPSEKGGKRMGRPSPLTGQVVVAISDARRVIYAAFERDGFDAIEDEALLLIDTAIYKGERADFARRASDVLRDSGELTPWIERQERELERDFAHVRELQAA